MESEAAKGYTYLSFSGSDIHAERETGFLQIREKRSAEAIKLWEVYNGKFITGTHL